MIFSAKYKKRRPKYSQIYKNHEKYKIKIFALMIAVIILIFISIGIFNYIKNYKSGEAAIILGSWESTKLGITLEEFGLSLPVVYTFNSDNTFTCTLTIFGKKQQYHGMYSINSLFRPTRLILYRNDNENFEGIIHFFDKNSFKAVIFNKTYFFEKEEFIHEIVQYFKRVD